MPVLAGAFALGLLVVLIPAWGQLPQDRSALEQQLENLKQEIEQIRERLDDSLRERDQALDRLAIADRAVSEAERVRRQTLDEIGELGDRIEVLELEQRQLGEQAATSARLLARQLLLAYHQGGQSRLKLLLNQDDLRQLNRHLAYHGYLTRARVRLIDRLTESLAALDRARAELELRRDQLEALAQRQNEEIAQLSEAREEREQALAAVSARVRTEQQRLAELQQDAGKLSELLDQLATALADIPPEIEVPAFADLRGQLPRPVAGRLLHRFGEQRAGDLTWGGWLIQATAGSEVSAVAYGRVAYADWLRGYGLILILDHGDGYMTLYAHNEALLRDVGDWVGPGDLIATAGNSGGMSESGVYFELRRQGRPINPSGWFAR